MTTEAELKYLRRCVELAAEALAAGDEPFGSILVTADGAIVAEDRNRVGGGDRTRHPEFELARWAAEHLSPEARAAATVYTSGEHCPMCSAAHAWAGLGRIVYAVSAEQLSGWLAEWGAPPAPVRMLPIGEIAIGVTVEGPIPELTDEVRALHRACHERRAAAPPSTGAPAAGSAPLYGLIGRIHVAPGMRAVVVAALLEGVTAMPGCLSYVVAEDPGNPDAIWVTEVWDRKESHVASLALPAVQRAIATARPHITGFTDRAETVPLGGHGLSGGANPLR